jgi:Flp pilus assembly protein TadD
VKKESAIIAVVTLIIGFLLGLLVGARFISGTATVSVTQKPKEQVSASGLEPAEITAHIKELELIVDKEPKNLKALIELGNRYFDSNQAQKAVQTYSKALALDQNNANVLTDQGVMLRALGFFDRALANFEKANKVDPNHFQSLYNIGIVYAVDLKKTEKAREVFESLLKHDQTSPLAQQAREMLKQLPAPQ